MTVPAYLNSSYHYKISYAVTDVDTIISDFRDEVFNQLTTPWTEPSTGLFKNPENVVHRWFDVLWTKISATNLECRVRDWTGGTIATKRMYIDAAGTTIHYFTGQYHFLIQADRSLPELMGGGMLETSPDAPDGHPYTVYMGPYARDSSGNYGDEVWWAGSTRWAGDRAYGITSFMGPGGQSYRLQTMGGHLLWTPCMWGQDLAPQLQLGRRYQAICCDTQIGVGSRFTVPIDENTNGIFQKVFPGTSYGSPVGYGLAFRVG